MERRGILDDRVAGAARPRRSTLIALAAAAAIAAAALTADAAAAAGGGATPVVAVLPDTSGLELGGYPPATRLQVEVQRDGVRTGRATITTDAAGAAAVNGGTAACWTDATPDLRPGDTVRVSGAGSADTATTADVAVQTAVQTAADTVVVHGTARAPDGSAPALAGLEARIVAAAGRPFSGGRAALRAGAGLEFPLAQDAADPTQWTATFSGLGAADVAGALGAADVRAIAADGGGNPTIAQAAGARGPVAPCTAPMHRNAVVDANRIAVNAETAAADLVLAGVAEDADDVTVTLDDENADTPPVAVPATLSAPTGAQSFTATVPGADVRGLADGALTASASYIVGGAAVTGADLTLRKDTVAPDAPAATPGPSVYAGAQEVAIDDADPTAAIHWTAGETDPTAASDVYAGPILLTASQTLRAVAIDPAGNASTVAVFPFTIVPPAPLAVAPIGTIVPLTTARPGAAKAVPLRLALLAAPRRISARRLRSAGLRLAMRVPAEAVVVHVAVYRAGLGGMRTGEPVAAADRLAAGANTVMHMRLRDRSFRRLRRGRYLVDVRVGRGRIGLGPAATARLTVTR